jgi:hypothetical protein
MLVWSLCLTAYTLVLGFYFRTYGRFIFLEINQKSTIMKGIKFKEGQLN